MWNKVEAGCIICGVHGSGVTIKGSFWQYVTAAAIVTVMLPAWRAEHFQKWRGSGQISKWNANKCRHVHQGRVGVTDRGQRTRACGVYNWRLPHQPETRILESHIVSFTHISLAIYHFQAVCLENKSLFRPGYLFWSMLWNLIHGFIYSSAPTVTCLYTWVKVIVEVCTFTCQLCINTSQFLQV